MPRTLLLSLLLFCSSLVGAQTMPGPVDIFTSPTVVGRTVSQNFGYSCVYHDYRGDGRFADVMQWIYNAQVKNARDVGGNAIVNWHVTMGTFSPTNSPTPGTWIQVAACGDIVLLK